MKQPFFSIPLLMCFLLVPHILRCQQNPPRDFAPPLDIPLTISSNFGELRMNQFHFGIDFKTGGNTGLKVHSIDTGYVSRIKVESGGYGRALYITHPNGYVSVYAHLMGFNPAIADFCKSEQYRLKQCAVDIAVKRGLLSVNKGEIVAFSGNSGFSSGAHLHFEIREEKTEATLNVLRLFHFPVPDALPPVFSQLWIYPIDSISTVNAFNRDKNFPLTHQGSSYVLNGQKPVSVSGNIAFGIQAHDVLNNTAAQTGIYAIELYIDDALYFSQVLDRLSFTEMRYVNSVLDYEKYVRNSEKVNRLFLQPNNQLPIYNNVVQRGVVTVNDTVTRNVRIIIRDAALNESELRFSIKGIGSKRNMLITKKVLGSQGQKISWKQANTIIRGNFILTIPQNALYDDLYFEYSKLPGHGFYSDIHVVHNMYTPMHKASSLFIKPVHCPARLLPKALIVNIGKNNKISPVGGTYKDGYIEAGIKSFGKYAITVDTTPPVITPMFKPAGKNDFSGQDEIRFMILDTLSGIQSYLGTLDGKWALFEYDAKDHLLYHKFDSSHLTFGQQHVLNLTVTDERGNKSEYHTSFFK